MNFLNFDEEYFIFYVFFLIIFRKTRSYFECCVNALAYFLKDDFLIFNIHTQCNM